MQALIRVYPTSLPRTSEVTVDPLVLLFTLGVSIATGLVFGLAPLMHTRASGLVTALKEGGAKGATGAARHHVRRALVMAEVALARDAGDRRRACCCARSPISPTSTPASIARAW